MAISFANEDVEGSRGLGISLGPKPTTTLPPVLTQTPQNNQTGSFLQTGGIQPTVANQLTTETPPSYGFNGFINFFKGLFDGSGSFQAPAKDTSPILSVSIKELLKANLGVQHILNSHGYEFELYIINSTGKALPISPTAVQNLKIEHCLSDWSAFGELTISYDNEFGDQEFLFRNDGEDLIRFRLYPLNDARYNNFTPTRKIWELNFVFSITDVQDVTPKTKSNTDASRLTKLKKFYFHDVREYLLKAQNIEYSTAYSPEAAINFLPLDFQGRYSDSNRSILTGTCINELIKQSLNYDPVLAKTGVDVNAAEEWDKGATQIFFTSGSHENSYEAIKYIHGHHVSETVADFSILDIERDEKGIGYFSLKPLSRYFAKAGNKPNEPGPYQLEHFFLSNDAYKDKTSANQPLRAPILANGAGDPINDLQKDIKVNDFNIIDKYEFVDISPNINASLLTSRPVYSFDFNQRRFNIEFLEHSVSAAESIFNSVYIKNLYKARGNSNFLTPAISPSKLKNRSLFPKFSVYGDSDDPASRLPYGLQNLLKTGLFQNTCIVFTVPGLSFREPGRFIGIDRVTGSSNDNPVDNKLCGQWFVINVKHIIAVGMYYNTITAVKVHRHTPA
jgi:hypothetical protein